MSGPDMVIPIIFIIVMVLVIVFNYKVSRKARRPMIKAPLVVLPSLPRRMRRTTGLSMRPELFLSEERKMKQWLEELNDEKADVEYDPYGGLTRDDWIALHAANTVPLDEHEQQDMKALEEHDMFRPQEVIRKKNAKQSLGKRK